MKIFSLILLSLFFTESALAIPNIYLRSTNEYFSTQYLVKGDKEVEFVDTTTNEEVNKFFSDNELASKYILKYESDVNAFHISLWSGLGVALAYLFLTDSPSGGVYYGIFGVGLFTSIYFQQSAKSNLLKAINIYNGVPEKMSYNLPNSGPKLSYSWSF